MKGIDWLIGLGLTWTVVGITGCAAVPPTSGVGGVTSGKTLPALPVITQSFASPRLRPGETWKVYFIASDPEGEMKNIVCTIDQPGVGEYPISITRIDWGNRKELNGYIYLATSTFAHLDGVYLTLTVQIQDTTGRYSKPAKLPLSLNNLYQQEPPPPGVFKDSDLGPIMIQVHGLRGEDLSPTPFFRFP